MKNGLINETSFIFAKTFYLAISRERYCPPSSVGKYCKSCSICLVVTKSGSRKVHMATRSVLSEQFESVAFDLVGPLPK